MVEIIHYEQANKNKTIGFVDIKVPIVKPTTLIFRKIAHLQSGEKKWFNFPSFSRDIQGSTNYFKYFQFEIDGYNAKLMESLPEKVKEYCIAHGIIDENQINFNMFADNEEIPF